MSAYIFGAKGPMAKGGNRWCTTAYRAIRGLKMSKGPERHAKVLYMVGDNFTV